MPSAYMPCVASCTLQTVRHSDTNVTAALFAAEAEQWGLSTRCCETWRS